MAGNPKQSKPVIPYKWELIGLLWFSYFLNQGDRQIFNVVIPLIKDDLKLDDVQVGLVATVFTLVYGLLVPIAGVLSDRFDKSKILFLSLLIFSAGTLLTGIGNGVFGLILFRSIATGGGEAFYYPAANSLIAQYHSNTRAMAMSIHQTSLYVGIVLSGFIAGYLGENYGWRVAFYAFGLMGILWAFVVLLRVKEKVADPAQVKEESRNLKLLPIIKAIVAKKTAIYLSVGFSFMCFVNIGYLTWMPTFLHEKYHLSLASSGLNSTLYHFMGAFVGVLIGAKISDKWALKRKQIRLEVEIFGLLVGAPFIYWIGMTDSLLMCYVAMALFGVFRGIYDSNLFAALFDVIEPQFRATATGFMLSFGFIVGAVAPVLLGYIKMEFGLEYGISLLALFYILGAISIFIALRLYYKKEYYTGLSNNYDSSSK